MREGDYEGCGDQEMGFRAKFDLERKTQLVFRKGEKGRGKWEEGGMGEYTAVRTRQSSGVR